MSERQSLYHISEGGRRTARRRRRERPSVLRRLLCLCIPLVLILLLFNLRLSPILTELARTEVERMTEHLLAEAVVNELESAEVPYSDIVTLTYKSDGSVASMQTDTAELLRLRTQLVRAALSSVKRVEAIPAEVPLFAVLGLNFSSSPTLSLHMSLSRSVNAYFLSSFEERGINQTRHTILFRISVEVYLLIPSRAKRITVERDFPLTETVIVGNVPDAYTHIHRLTDDISEGEIDDIYDFGADKN